MDDWEVFPREAAVVGTKAIEQGVARIILTNDELFAKAAKIIQKVQKETRVLIEAGLIPKAE